MPNKNLLFVGIKGTAVALDRESGREMWRTPLKGSDLVNLVLDGEELYAATKGELFRLDPRSGRILWNNDMPGLGWGMMTIGAAAGVQQAAILAEKQRRDQQAAADGAIAATGD